ncbi:MAG TPA: hypothetical protein V6C84_30800 [Coleofasciculaceae cyanobacterium]
MGYLTPFSDFILRFKVSSRLKYTKSPAIASDRRAFESGSFSLHKLSTMEMDFWRSLSSMAQWNHY